MGRRSCRECALRDYTGNIGQIQLRLLRSRWWYYYDGWRCWYIPYCQIGRALSWSQADRRCFDHGSGRQNVTSNKNTLQTRRESFCVFLFKLSVRILFCAGLRWAYWLILHYKSKFNLHDSKSLARTWINSSSLGGDQSSVVCIWRIY